MDPRVSQVTIKGITVVQHKVQQTRSNAVMLTFDKGVEHCVECRASIANSR